MEEKQFEQLTGDEDFDEALGKCIHVLADKGEDYAMGSSDRLHNFRTSAAFLGLDMKQAWSVYFYKHVSAIFAYVKNGGQHESEPIEGRIVDAINYLLLFYKLVKEGDVKETQPKKPDPSLWGKVLSILFEKQHSLTRTFEMIPSKPENRADRDKYASMVELCSQLANHISNTINEEFDGRPLSFEDVIEYITQRIVGWDNQEKNAGKLSPEELGARGEALALRNQLTAIRNGDFPWKAVK